VRGELRGFYSPDLLAEGEDPDLEAFQPVDGENFGLAVTAFVGPNDEGGEEMFDFSSALSAGLPSIPLRRVSGSYGTSCS
jgi:hypothetical protein